jgi:hypothetical protein
MKAREFEEWLESGGARHLARQYAANPNAPGIESDGPVDDIMKWQNG